MEIQIFYYHEHLNQELITNSIITPNIQKCNKNFYLMFVLYQIKLVQKEK